MKDVKSFVLGRAALFACLLLVLIPLSAALGQSEGTERWSPPQEISVGWWQSVALDKQGNLHLAWYNIAASSDDVLRDALWYARRDLSGQWTAPNNVLVTGVGGFTVRNALATTKDGMLHTVFRAGILHQVANVLGDLAPDAANWSKGRNFDDNGYYVDMIADDNDVLHVAASGYNDLFKPKALNAEASPCAFCYDLFYRRSTDGGLTWSLPYPFSVDPNTGSDRVDLFQGASERLYATWDEGLDWYVGRGAAQDVRIVYSDDAGLTWSEPVVLDGGLLPDRRPIQLAATELRDGSVLAVWRYSSDIDRNIYYQVSRDLKVWSDPQPIGVMVARNLNDTPLDDYELITDRQGRAHLFAVGQPDVSTRANATLYHLVFQQGTWLAPQRVFYDPSMRPEWPKAVMGLENDIHLTWFIRGIREGQRIENEDFTRILRVYYSHLEGNLPLQPTVTFAPTVTPLPSPTPFQLFEATPTPFPTVQPIVVDNATPMQTADNYAMQVLVGGTLFAVLFCGGILFLLRFRR